MTTASENLPANVRRSRNSLGIALAAVLVATGLLIVALLLFGQTFFGGGFPSESSLDQSNRVSPGMSSPTAPTGSGSLNYQ